MPRPTETPIGRELAQTAKQVSRAFDDALAAVGGSRSQWLVLLSLKAGRATNQRELAEAVGIRGATLTHHLNAMEADGLITRARHPENRRVHVVALTDAGERTFHELRRVAVAHDRRLRGQLKDADVAKLRALLGKLRENVAEA